MALKDELIAMQRADYELRAKLAREGRLSDDYDPDMEALHIQNADRLTDIIDESGAFPSRANLGDEAFGAAWVIVQHAISRPELQKRCLETFRRNNPGVSAVQLACLEDRICFFEGRGQVYGTNFDWDESGQLSPVAVADPDRVDERRRTIGLEPLQDAVEKVRAHARSEGDKAPKNPAAKAQRFLEWKRRVGWDV